MQSTATSFERLVALPQPWVGDRGCACVRSFSRGVPATSLDGVKLMDCRRQGAMALAESRPGGLLPEAVRHKPLAPLCENAQVRVFALVRIGPRDVAGVSP